MNISHVLMSYFRSLCNFRCFQNGKRKPRSPFCFSNLLSLRCYSQTTTEQVFPHWRHSLNVRFHVTAQKHLFLSINSGRRDVWHRNTPFIQILDFVEIPVECADILWLDGYLDMSCVLRGGNSCTASWDLQLFLKFSPKGSMLRNILNLTTQHCLFFFFLSWNSLFHLKPHNFQGRISTFMYIYFLEAT